LDNLPMTYWQASVIQAAWKGRHCRAKVARFSRLPDDLWRHVLRFLNTSVVDVIDRLLALRAIRFYWTAPRSQWPQKMHTLYLIRKYVSHLSERTYYKSFALCLRLLQHSDRSHELLLINATLERMLGVFSPSINERRQAA
jgi:hypothetical protein